MIPTKKVEQLVDKYQSLEKELSSGNIDKKDFAIKSKEYSSLGEIIQCAREYLNFENQKKELDKMINEQNIATKIIEYAEPIRVNTNVQSMTIVSEITYCAFMVVLLHIFLRLAMEETSFRSFWKYWHIATFAVIAWSGLFYAIGVPLWQIIVVIAIAIISAPNVMHIISTYIIGEHRDDAIKKWEG